MKTVVVTGGTRGIGEGIARRLADADWQVIAASASKEERDAFEEHPFIVTRALDVTDNVSVAELFRSLDRLDGLVNCAGILRRGEEYEIEVFQRVLEVNLTGTMRCCLAARDLLEASRGAIVNTA